jgi:hypothetical protein
MSKLAAGIIEVKTPEGALSCAGKFTYQLAGVERKPVPNHQGGVDYIETYVEGFIEGEVLVKTGTDPSKIRDVVDAEITLSLGQGPSGPVATVTLFEAFHGPPIEGDSDTGVIKVKYFGRTEMIVK